MADGTRVGVDLVVVAAWLRLVSEEVNGLVLNAAWLLRLVLEVAEAVGLIPASGEDVEGDLTTNREAMILLARRCWTCHLSWRVRC